METNLKLAQFLDTVNQGVDVRIAQEREAVQAEAEALLAHSEEQSIANAERQITAEKSRIVAKYRRRLSQTGFQCRTAMLQHRQALLQQLFAELQERLQRFVASSAYQEWLCTLLQRIQPAAGATIYLRSADQSMVDTLRTVCNETCRFCVDDTIQMGGCIVQAADGYTLQNHTLDEAFGAQVRNFHRDFHLDGGVFVCHKQ